MFGLLKGILCYFIAKIYAYFSANQSKMKTLVCILSLICLAAAMPSYRPHRTAEDLTAEEIELLADLAERVQRYETTTRNLTDEPTDLRTGKGTELFFRVILF